MTSSASDAIECGPITGAAAMRSAALKTATMRGAHLGGGSLRSVGAAEQISLRRPKRIDSTLSHPSSGQVSELRDRVSAVNAGTASSSAVAAHAGATHRLACRRLGAAGDLGLFVALGSYRLARGAIGRPAWESVWSVNS